ncbi:GATA zinc finger domain-containing protein 14-like [Diaphorina citri]|uniref:GATA zinc finger domain-containing protein 14-like n=1 Tax=Diaphorina citri TaxID=121845 RepID=A0A1S4E6P8_DIACI|nr:GATA zinc finger domain-containing protein 14-like [Diaphorina citri]
MQSATLLEPHQSAPNDPLHNLTTGTHLSRMGPVPEFLRPLPVLSSSNGNTTLKYKKAAILNHNLKQEHDAKYYGKYDPIRKYETSENGYGGNKDVTTSGGDNENENNFNSKPSGNTVYPKHFASMQGPYGIINNNLFIKKEDKEADEAKTRSRLDSDLLNNNTSDKNSSHMNYYSGQFQANFIGHINNQNYLNRPLTVPSSQPGYFNGHGNVSDRIDNSDPSSSQPESPNRQHPRGASPQKPENFPTNQETNPELGNKKFKVPTSKVPKESLLKYRILHKNNQRNVTQISNNPPAESPPTELNPSTNAGSIPRNEAPCDSNSNSTETSSVHFKRPDSDTTEPSGMNVHFKKPESDNPATAPEPSGIHFKRPETDNLPEPSGSVINSDIKPNHFSKGVLIKLENGLIKHLEDLKTEDFVSSAEKSARHRLEPSTVPSRTQRKRVLIKLENGLIKHLEDLKTEDFVSSAEKSARHRLEPSTVMKIEEKEGASVVLTLCYGERKHQMIVP